MGGIAFYHKIHGWYDPRTVFIIKKLLEGCNRLKKTKDVRAPILRSSLKLICNQLAAVCVDAYETILFKAVYQLTYFGLFRVSELVQTSVSDNEKPLKVEDVTFTPDRTSMTVRIRQSKTNQKGQPTFLNFPCECDSDLCPVCAVINYCQIRPKTNGLFFIHKNCKALTRYQFSAVLAKAIREAKIGSQHFRAHSFRIGRATQLASDGVPMHIIQKLGRWRSTAVKTYIRCEA